MKLRISYNYEIDCKDPIDGRLKFLAEKALGREDWYFTYVSARPIEKPGLLAQVKEQLVG